MRSIHSWSLVYLKPSGYAIVAPRRVRRTRPTSVAAERRVRKGPGLPIFLSLVKRHRYDARAGAATADVDIELGTWCVVFDRQVGHADRFLDVRRLGAAGHHTDFRGADVGIVAVPADAALEHLEADNPASRPARLLLAEGARAD